MNHYPVLTFIANPLHQILLIEKGQSMQLRCKYSSHTRLRKHVTYSLYIKKTFTIQRMYMPFFLKYECTKTFVVVGETTSLVPTLTLTLTLVVNTLNT